MSPASLHDGQCISSAAKGGTDGCPLNSQQPQHTQIALGGRVWGAPEQRNTGQPSVDESATAEEQRPAMHAGAPQQTGTQQLSVRERHSRGALNWPTVSTMLLWSRR